MNKKAGVLWFATAVLLPLLSLSQIPKQALFTVSGTIRGVKNDSVVVIVTHYTDGGSRTGSDTLVTRGVNDRFRLQGTVSKPKLAWMQIGGMRSRKSTSFFLEKGEIVIDGSLDSLERLSFTGTPSNNDMTQSRGYTNNVYDNIKLQREKVKKYPEGSEEYRKLNASIAAGFDAINAYEVQFIKTHPASQMSSIYLYVKQDKLPVDEVEKLYNGLRPEVRANDMVSMIPDKIRAKRRVAVGNSAPDFASSDTAGRTVKLSDFRGKYVLLDFWASWCVPCRKQSPELLEIYKKYAAKGFTILQYSVDDKKDADKWKAAIQKDALSWPQVSDLAGFESKVSKLYGVQPIPDNFLIDANGIILARGLEPKELDEKLYRLFQGLH